MYPANTNEIFTQEREVYPDGSTYVVHLSDDRLQCYYCLLLKCNFATRFDLKDFPYDVQDLRMDFHFHEPWNLEKGKRDDSINGIAIKKCKLKLVENCFMSPEFNIQKV